MNECIKYDTEGFIWLSKIICFFFFCVCLVLLLYNAYISKRLKSGSLTYVSDLTWPVHIFFQLTRF